jgi:valyl-tRNA synthetase
VPPKEYCDIIYFKESKKIKKFINNNIEIIKQVGRVNNIDFKSDKNDSIIQIIILKEKIGLKFQTNIDLKAQKDKLSNKLNDLEKKINTLNQKLNNKVYIKKAPKDIVANDKILFKDLKIEQTKLKSIVSSIN